MEFTLFQKFALAVGVFAKFLWLYMRALIARPDELVLFMPQNLEIGGTRAFFRSFLDFIEETGDKPFLLLDQNQTSPETEQELQKNGIGYRFYSDELKYIECWYTKRHSLWRHFLKDFLQQSIFLLNIYLQYRPKYVCVSSAYPSSLFPALMLPGKVLYFVHSMPWGRLDPGKAGILREIMLPVLRKKIITVSEFSKTRILDYWGIHDFASRVDVIYNYAPYQTVVPKDHKNSGSTLTILTIGSLIHLPKRPDIFLAVAAALTEKYGADRLEFIWAGGGELLEQYQERADGYPNIHFVGHIKDLEPLYRKADIYFQPSEWESHGLAVVEAMSFGIPCIVANRGGMKESIIDGECGFLVELEDQDLILRRFVELIESPEKRSAFSIMAIERHKALFNQSKWSNSIKFQLLK